MTAFSIGLLLDQVRKIGRQLYARITRYGVQKTA